VATFRRFSGYAPADAKRVYDLLFKPAAERPALDDGEPDLDERHEFGCWSHCRRKAWEVATPAKIRSP
jgi:transposase